MKQIIFLLLVLSFNFSWATGGILNIKTKKAIGIDDFVMSVQKGTVLVIGESHAFQGGKNLDQKNQALLISKLVKKYGDVSVGMEFIQYTKQKPLDLYLAGVLNEQTFLKEVEWGGNPFEDYKEQIIAPRKGNGWTYGLNSPKELTSYISKNGIDNLTAELFRYLPPNYAIGSFMYRKRFGEQMLYLTNHGANLDNYFDAQSVWDDTMAWNASEIMKANPDQILVIIVGQFHVHYGLGLPNRLKERGLNKVLTIVQSSSYIDLPMPELVKEIYSDTYGEMADFFW